MFKREQECQYTLSKVDQGLFGMSNAAVSLMITLLSLKLTHKDSGLMQKEEWNNIGLGEVSPT